MSGQPGDRLRELLTTPWVRSRVLVHLAPTLPAEALTPAAYAARALGHQVRGGERLAAPALAAIAARAVELAELTGSIPVDAGVLASVPDELLPRALALARASEDVQRRVVLAPSVVHAGDADTALALLEEAAELAGDAETARYALEEIAPRLGAGQAGRALDLTLRIPYAWARLGIVAALAPSLSPDEAQRAFSAVSAFPGDDRLPVLAALVPRLDPGGRAGAGLDLRATLAGLPPETVLHVAVILAHGLPEEERAEALGLAMHAAGAAVDSPSAGPWPLMDDLIRLTAIAGPDRDDVAGAALRHADRLAAWLQAPLIVRLARALERSELRAGALAVASSRAPTAEEPWRVLADVAELASAEERAEAEQAAMAAAGGVTDDADRLEAMSELFDRFPHLQAHPSAAPGGSGSTVMEMVDAIVAEVPPGDRAALLTDAFYAHSGAPAASTPAAPAPRDEEPAMIPTAAAPRSAAPRGRFIRRPRFGTSAARSKRDEPRRPVVHTGFAQPGAPDDPLPRRRPLAPRRAYLFWLEVGEELAGSIEAQAVALPRDLPEGARVAVVLSAVSDGVVVDDAVGELEVRANGWAAVSRHAATVASARPRRLFFTVHVKASSGHIALRCSIYRNQVVVQSRLISARVVGGIGRAIPRRTPALVSTLDYVLARTLDPPVLAHVPEHRVSLMVNGDGSTHALQLVAVSTDPMFVGRADHEAKLRALGADLTWHYADTREETLRLLRESPGHLVYFYCHGGLTETNVPYLSVGPPGEAGIPSDIFRAMRIHWTRPRPLVFINGCHTTALSPEQALNFPARLVENAAAAGVIGTEITNFEPLASAFAEECLRRFLGGETIGEAVRGARLALLALGNPLGLIYVPFVLPSVRLVRA